MMRTALFIGFEQVLRIQMIETWKKHPKYSSMNKNEIKKKNKQNVKIQLFKAYKWKGIDKWNLIILITINFVNIETVM